MNWEKVRNEYLTGKKTSVELGKEYGINPSTLRSRISRERELSRLNGELKDRKFEVNVKGGEKSTRQSQNEKTKSDRESVQYSQDERIKRVLRIADLLSDKVERAVDELDSYVVKSKSKDKQIEYDFDMGKPVREVYSENEDIGIKRGTVDIACLKQLVDTLSDIKEIQMLSRQDDDNSGRITELIEGLTFQGGLKK